MLFKTDELERSNCMWRERINYTAGFVCSLANEKYPTNKIQDNILFFSKNIQLVVEYFEYYDTNQLVVMIREEEGN